MSVIKRSPFDHVGFYDLLATVVKQTQWSQSEHYTHEANPSSAMGIILPETRNKLWFPAKMSNIMVT